MLFPRPLLRLWVIAARPGLTHIQARTSLDGDRHPLLFGRITDYLAAVHDHQGHAGSIPLHELGIVVNVLHDQVERKRLVNFIEVCLGLFTERAVGLGVERDVGDRGFALPDAEHMVDCSK